MLLSTFGIILGVAAILGIRVTNQNALEAVKQLFENTTGKTDLIVVSTDADESGFSERTLSQLERMAEIEYAVPSLQIMTAPADSASSDVMGMSFFGMDTGGLQLYGIDPELDGQVRIYELMDGRFLSPVLDEQEIVLVDAFAKENEITVGDTIEIITEIGIEELTVVGLIEKKGAGQLNNGAFGVLPIETAQKFFYSEGDINQIDLVLRTNNSGSDELDQAKLDIQTKLGDDYSVVYPAAQGQRMTQMLSNYQIGLNFLSAMALFVGAFLVYNSFSMSVVERTREFGMLRTTGMTKGQIIRLIISEALVLGVIGSLLGALLGVFLARGLSAVMGALLSQEMTQIYAQQGILITSVIIGIVVAVISAMIPALQAGRISPMEALRIRTKTRHGWLLEKGWIPGLILLIVSAVILVLNPFPYDPQFRMGSMVVVFLFLGGTLSIPASVGFWERILKPLTTLIFGRSGVIGSSNIQRAKLRTTLTVAALMVGASMMIIVWAITDSFKVDLDEWLKGYMGGDLYVTSPLSMGTDVWRRLESVEGVEAAAPTLYKNVEWSPPSGEMENADLMAIDPSSHLQVTSFVFADEGVDMTKAVQSLDQGDNVFISTVLSELYDIQQGDTIMIKTRTGNRPFRVAAVVVDFYQQGYVITIGWTNMKRHFREDEAQAYLLKVQDGYKIDQVSQRIEDLYGDRYRLSLISNQDLLNQVTVMLDQAFSMFDVLAIIAILVGFFGIANTLTMSVIERTREIGMLRGVGMTRSQILAMILAEAATLGFIGGLLGLFFGIILSQIFILAMTAMSGYQITYTFHIQKGLTALVIAVIISQLAAMIPASRAARIRILDAIQYE